MQVLADLSWKLHVATQVPAQLVGLAAACDSGGVLAGASLAVALLTPSARSLPGTTACRSETLAGPPGKALARRASRATARPMPAKSPPSFACSCQPNQLGRHLRGNMQLPGQLSKRLRGGMQIFVEALPPRHISCLPAYMAPHASLAGTHVKARRSGDGRDGPRPRPR